MNLNNNEIIKILHSLEIDSSRVSRDIKNSQYKTMIDQQLVSFFTPQRKSNCNLVKEYKGFVPSIGDNRYSKYPNKPLIDDLRVKFFKECEPKDLSITYLGVREAFNNDFHLYVHTYAIRGIIKFNIMFEQLHDFSKQNPQPTIIVRLPIKSLFDNEANNAIDLLVNFIQNYAGSPVNFIYTDKGLNEITFARIGSAAIDHNNMPYYNFFYNFFDSCDDSWLKNVIYFSFNEELLQEEIIYINNSFFLPYGEKIAYELGITTDTLNIFNEAAKGKILNKSHNIHF